MILVYERSKVQKTNDLVDFRFGDTTGAWLLYYLHYCTYGVNLHILKISCLVHSSEDASAPRVSRPQRRCIPRRREARSPRKGSTE